MNTITLKNGVKMPLVGFGTFQISDISICEQAVLDAISCGYRMIDTAVSYKNEGAVGSAVKKCGMPRSDLFITSKVYLHQMGYKKTIAACNESLKKLQLEYLDLYLIHMPLGDYYGSWRAFEQLYHEGKIRAIGVSNFLSDRLIDLCMNVSVIPMVNQIEHHPFYQRTDELLVMKEYGIQAEAWAPFAEGMNHMFTNPVLCEIAAEHHKSVAQIILRWNIECGLCVIVKSVHKERIAENFEVNDFSLTPDDIKRIESLDLNKPLMFDPRIPAEVKRVYDYMKHPVVTSLRQ